MPAARTRSLIVVALVLATTLAATRTPAEQGPMAQAPDDRPPVPAAASSQPKPFDVDVVFADGSLLKLQLLDDALDFVTPYGPLRIPVRNVCRVEFGLRVTDEERAAIDAAVAELLGPVPAKRETAKAALRGFGPRAVPAVRRAARAAGDEVAAHVQDLLGDMAPGRGDADPRDHDLVVTEDSRIAGRLTAGSLRVMTSQFGEQRLKFAGVRAIEAAGAGGAALAAADGGGPVEDAPPNMMQMASRRGQVLRLRVTAGVGGTVWGTGVHTLDSHLPTAVVHAGVLQPGQTGVVRVKMVESPPAFVGSTRNGITSHPYGPFPQGGYEVLSSARR